VIDDLLEPEEVKYDYELTYIRPNGSIASPDRRDPSSAHLWVGRLPHSRSPALVKRDEYLFYGEIREIPSSICEIYVVDPKRFKETSGSGPIWGNPHSVGDIFILECKQTGFRKRLKSIVDNSNFFSNLPEGYEAKKARFRIQADGSIIDVE